MQGARLILASASPRRRDLLRQIGLIPDAVEAADIDETPQKSETVRAYTARLAAAKCAAVASRHPDAYVLAADTEVARGRRILGKPADEAAAERHLDLLSGCRHRVITSVAVTPPGGPARLKTVVTQVTFKRLSAAERHWYLASGEWRDKAGGYDIRGAAGVFVKALNGSYSNVVGLPIYETSALLVGLGFPLFSQSVSESESAETS